MDNFIPIFLFAVIGTAVCFWLVTRHRERMSIIDKGVAADDIKALYQTSWKIQPLSSLKWGLILVFLGAGLFIGVRLKETAGMSDGVTVATVAICGGIGLVVFYLLARRHAESR